MLMDVGDVWLLDARHTLYGQLYLLMLVQFLVVRIASGLLALASGHACDGIRNRKPLNICENTRTRQPPDGRTRRSCEKIGCFDNVWLGADECMVSSVTYKWLSPMPTTLPASMGAEPRSGSASTGFIRAQKRGRKGSFFTAAWIAIFCMLVGCRIGEAANPGPLHSLDNPDDVYFEHQADLYLEPTSEWMPDDMDGIPDLIEEFDEEVPFWHAKSFTGARAGYVFKSGPLGIGYYCDDRDAAFRHFLQTTEQQEADVICGYLFDAKTTFGSPLSQLLDLSSLIAAPPKCASDPRKVRTRKPRKRPSNRTRKPKAGLGSQDWTLPSCLGVSKADRSHRPYGLWACDTYNGNVMATAHEYMRQSGADFCMLQESRTLEGGTAAASRSASRIHWNLALTPAAVTEAGSSSAGVGVATRAHVGMADIEHLDIPESLWNRCCIKHVGAVCRGGIFIISAYFWTAEGLSDRNRRMLNDLAFVISRLHGPWILGADFNFPPSLLEQSGWLQLVSGKTFATGQVTCKAQETDYFVVCKQLFHAVVHVALVHDTGAKPHTAVRMWLRGQPRKDLCRTVVTPRKVPGILPAACLESRFEDGWDFICSDGGSSPSLDHMLNTHYPLWLDRVESCLDSLATDPTVEGRKVPGRGAGCRIVWKPAAGAIPGTASCKVSLTTVAWRTVAGWATDVASGLSAGAPKAAFAKAARARWLILGYSWEKLGNSIHAKAFRSWVGCIRLHMLHDRGQTDWIRRSASLITCKAIAYDAAMAQKAWKSWMNDGPGRSLGRLHSMTRTKTGWIPSMVARSADCEDSSMGAGEDMEPTEDLVAASLPAPLSSQAEVDAEANKWAAEWNVGGKPPFMSWPDAEGMGELQHMAVDMVRKAAYTFPITTGLGWDKLHPRALLRLPDSALEALVRIFLIVELLGDWPEAIGIILVVLIPKPDGGRRPIGLLPSLIRLWMRIRLDVISNWQGDHERDYFYAGPRKGAAVAAWKQAARAEFAAETPGLAYANALLDQVKCFEHIPHGWLVMQAKKYSYPLHVLRASLASYRLLRVIMVEGICSEGMLALQGITAGSGHAVIELRLLMLQWLDETVALYHIIVITVYIDDTSLEASGSPGMVEDAVVGATNYLANALTTIGLKFSPTKNAILATDSGLASAIARRLPKLTMALPKGAKSLGGALGAGRRRNAQVAAKRLKNFKARKPHFKKLRRAAGAARTALVLRTGGTAALTYGQANMGISNSMLQSQRSATAAAYARGGHGDLDLSLIMADASLKGMADPAFQAHMSPIGMWAEAVWGAWMPSMALQRMVVFAISNLKHLVSVWNRVRGPAAAFVASAWRLGWKVQSYRMVIIDDGTLLDFLRDPRHMCLCRSGFLFGDGDGGELRPNSPPSPKAMVVMEPLFNRYTSY